MRKCKGKRISGRRYQEGRTVIMLWKSILLTIIICGLFVLGASNIIADQAGNGDAIEPVGTVAVSSEASPVDIEE